MVDGGFDDIFGAEDVGLDGLDGEEFARWDLLQSGGVENKINAIHGIVDTAIVADVADEKLDFVVLIFDAHVFLLFFVAGEDADFLELNVIFEKTIENFIAEGAGTTSN